MPRFHHTAPLALLLACSILPAAASGQTTVNLDATIHGAPSAGFTGLPVSFEAGTYEFTLIQGQYTAWRFGLPSTSTWRTAYEVRFANGNLLFEGGARLEEASAQEAFDATPVKTHVATVPSDQTLFFNVSDHILHDNTGGVSVLITEISIPIRPATWGAIKRRFE